MAELGNGEARLRGARQPQSLTHPGEVSLSLSLTLIIVCLGGSDERRMGLAI